MKPARTRTARTAQASQAGPRGARAGAHGDARIRARWRAAAMPLACGAVLLVLAALGALLDARGLLAAWLAAWWFWAGLALGAQATLWLHRLTGGAWMAPIAPCLHALRAAIPAVAILVLPILLWQPPLYPWARDGWVDRATEPAFRHLWFTSTGMALRVIACVAIWSLLARVDAAGGAASRRAGYAAAGLLAYAFTISLAAVDLLMSLTPEWYSTAFGFMVLVAQLKAAMAAGVWAGAERAPAPLRGDLGNLLLMYVLTWAYLAFTQFQIIWAENLPAEISWYLPRSHDPWLGMAVLLTVAGFALPLLALLFRAFKQSAPRLRMLAGLLLLVAACETAWWVFPSVAAVSRGAQPGPEAPVSWHACWMLLLLLAGMGSMVRATALLFPGARQAQRSDDHA